MFLSPSSIFLKHLDNDILDIYENTIEPEKSCQKCDIIISASSICNHVTSDFVKFNGGIIDGGAYDNQKNIVSSSVDLKSVIDKAGWISPSPGGLGPITVAWLFYNVFLSYFKQNDIEFPTFYQMQSRLQIFLKNFL